MRREIMEKARDELVKRNAEKWKIKYGLSWYNDVRVLAAQKRAMHKAYAQYKEGTA